MDTFAIILWLVGAEITVPLQQGVGCDEYIKYLETIERITYDVPSTYLDGVELIGYTCKLLKTQE
jgi:hypothetical protein